MKNHLYTVSVVPKTENNNPSIRKIQKSITDFIEGQGDKKSKLTFTTDENNEFLNIGVLKIQGSDENSELELSFELNEQEDIFNILISPRGEDELKLGEDELKGFRNLLRNLVQKIHQDSKARLTYNINPDSSYKESLEQALNHASGSAVVMVNNDNRDIGLSLSRFGDDSLEISRPYYTLNEGSEAKLPVDDEVYTKQTKFIQNILRALEIN